MLITNSTLTFPQFCLFIYSNTMAVVTPESFPTFILILNSLLLLAALSLFCTILPRKIKRVASYPETKERSVCPRFRTIDKFFVLNLDGRMFLLKNCQRKDSSCKFINFKRKLVQLLRVP